jgi:co-chaperonin GroES (HSP10)
VDIIPYPGYIIVNREHKNESTDAGVFVPRQDQEETNIATVIHPGVSEFKFGDHLIVMPHAGTDFWWDDGDMEMTILDQETEVLACVEL